VLNPNSEKAYWRAARALFATEKLVDAIDCCDRGLKVNPENKDFATFKAKIEKRKEEVERYETEKAERARRKKEMDITLKRAFLARGLWLQPTLQPPNETAEPHFDPEALPAHSKPDIPLSGPKAKTWRAPDPLRTPLIFPVFLAYPEYFQSDLISKFHEDNSVGAYLDEMFPGPGSGVPRLSWDVHGEYNANTLNVYAATHKKRLLKVGRKMTLRDVVDRCAKDAEKPSERDGLVLADGLLSLAVLPKDTPAEQNWIDNFKKDRDHPYKQP